MGARENRTGVYEMPNNPDIPDLFRIALRDLRLSLRTHTAATVVAYDSTKQKVTVTVDILQVIKDNAATPTVRNPNPVKAQDPVTLKNIPVAWPRTNSGYFTLPLNPGDTGELHVQDRSLEQWLKIGKATDPVSAFTHNLAHSVFHPTIQSDPTPINPPTGTDPTAAVIEGPLVKLGALAAHPLIKGTELVSAFTAYTGAIASAGATWGATVPPTPASNGAFIGSLITATATLATSIASWSSTKSLTE